MKENMLLFIFAALSRITFTYSWYIRKPDGHALELAIVLINQEVIIIFIVNLKSENIPYLIM